jgi:hypothetical protein
VNFIVRKVIPNPGYHRVTTFSIVASLSDVKYAVTRGLMTTNDHIHCPFLPRRMTWNFELKYFHRFTFNKSTKSLSKNEHVGEYGVGQNALGLGSSNQTKN